ncbi:hypothetical protein FE633_45725, partial [Streptomyces montanus]
RLGPVAAPGAVGAAWVALLVAAERATAGSSGISGASAPSGSTLAPFTAEGQVVAAVVAALAVGLLCLVRDRFDFSSDHRSAA